MKKAEIQKYFKKVGYKSDDILEVWYNNPNELRDKLDRYIPTLGQKIEKLIRWRTEKGLYAADTIREFITDKINLTKELNERNFKDGNYNIKNTIIDFNEIRLDGKSINEFLYSEIPHSYSLTNWNDVMGIPLCNIYLNNIIIKNACFSHALFRDSTLQHIQFENCNLNDCDFSNSHISLLQCDLSGSFSNSNWTNSSVNALEISSKSFGTNPKYTKIGFFALLRIAVFRETDKDATYTDFLSNDLVLDDLHHQFKTHIDYISWYQNTVNEFTDSYTDSSLNRIKNIANTVATKNWSSASQTLVTGFLIMILFSFIYFFSKSYFVNINDLGGALNYSIQIFTNLGMGDMKPNLSISKIGSWITSIESIIGYVWLALTLMVFSKKIFK